MRMTQHNLKKKTNAALQLKKTSQSECANTIRKNKQPMRMLHYNVKKFARFRPVELEDTLSPSKSNLIIEHFRVYQAFNMQPN